MKRCLSLDGWPSGCAYGVPLLLQKVFYASTWNSELACILRISTYKTAYFGEFMFKCMFCRVESEDMICVQSGVLILDEKRY